MDSISEHSSKSSYFLKNILILICSVVILYFGASFIIPLVYGGMLAMLVLPIVRWAKSKKLNEFLAIGIGVSVILLVFVLFLGLIYWQSLKILQNSSAMADSLEQIITNLQSKIEKFYDIPMYQQQEKLQETVQKIKKSLPEFFNSLLTTISDLFLIFVYVIIFLIERKRFKLFLLKLMNVRYNSKTLKTIDEITATVKDYLYGQLLVTLILGIVYAIGFALIGVRFSLILAIVAAILTFIPYLGNILGAILVVLIGLTSGLDFKGVILILIFLSLVQFVESYILKPWIIGNEISLNIVAVIVSVVGFSILWGVAGAIIALPLTSIFRVIFSKVTALKPYEYLLSDKKLSELK